MPDHHRPRSPRRIRRLGAPAAAALVVLSGLGLAAFGAVPGTLPGAWAGSPPLPATPAPLATFVTPAAAPCAPREVLLRRLAEGYGEAPRALGLTGNGALLELLVSPGGRSFSILMTRPPSVEAPGRVSCLVAAGEGWRDMEQVAQDPQT